MEFNLHINHNQQHQNDKFNFYMLIYIFYLFNHLFLILGFYSLLYINYIFKKNNYIYNI